MALRPLILQPDSEPYGACRALLRAIRAMPEGAVRPVVVFPYEGAALEEYRASGCTVRVEPLPVLRRASAGPAGLARLLGEVRSSSRSLSWLARREKCDLVHTNSMTIVGGTAAARRAGIPHVWQLREAPRERGMKARVLRALLARADRVLAVSAAAAQLAPAGATVIHDGYDVPAASAPISPFGRRGEFVVGMVGRISPSKAPHVMVEALGLLRSRDITGVRLVLAGTVYRGYEQYAQEQVLERARELGVARQLDVLGWVDDPEPIYGRLDAFVIATATGEGFPGAVLEALAHGVPVISAATGGTGELVLDGETGIECRPGSAPDVAAALECLRDDPHERLRLGRHGRAHAAHFSVQASADQLLQAWREVAAHS